jgi:HD-like signal output (HDOD) protein
VNCLLVEQSLIDSYSDQRNPNSVLAADSYLVSEPTELIDDSASHPMMFDVFYDLNRGRIVVPSDPGIAIRVGRSLGPLGTDTARLASILSICPALTLKVLRAAKAARPDRVALHSSKQAVEQLGAEQAHALAINCVLRESLRTESTVVRERMRSWWERTMRVSAICAVLARMSERFDPDYAALIGLMHAIAEPVLLSYADRHQDLADRAALDNLVHDNRAELGRILLSMWGLPKEIVEAAARSNQWNYSGSEAADYTDILLVAEWHATIGGARSRRKPAIEEIPAFRRLGLQSCGPELGVRIVEAADQVIEKIEAVLIG